MVKMTPAAMHSPADRPHGRDVDFEDCWFEWFHERECHDRAWDDG